MVSRAACRRLVSCAAAGCLPRYYSFHFPQAQRMTSPQDLKDAGLKATLPRLKIINLFESSKVRHLTAEDVYKLLLGEGLDIGLATVYRVLTQFEQAGLLVRHHFESGKAVFELNQGTHHDHLVCMQCGRVEEFYDPEIEKRQVKVARERGFEISEHALYLYADCTKPKCPYRKGSGSN
jgi:Fur family transcriptional regulator, ferric uptake regulator